MEREVVERAQRGDHDAFATLVGATVARSDAIARLILREPERAKDAIQESYVRAWRDLPTLRDSERFEAWLRRLVVHACLNEARRAKRRPLEVELLPIDQPIMTDTAASLADRDEIERGFRRLAPEQRAVIVLHYYLGMPMPDVAAAMGIPLGTAQSRLHYALVAMRATVVRDPMASAAPAPGGQSA